jgi:DNA-binding NarL/FixJ family response regulator/nitrogen-specific signal transduction histidine kinase
MISLIGVTALGLIAGLVWLNRHENKENDNLNRILEEKIKEQYQLEAEQKIYESKTNTFINLAHETKTPLTLLNHYLDLHIKKVGISQELTNIKQSADKLTKDIVNFFDLDKLDRGLDLYNHQQNCNLSQLVSEVVIMFLPYAEYKQISITSNINQNSVIIGDPEAVIRILYNVIENALRYTPSNGTIEVTLVNKNDTEELSIKDSGNGIPPDFHKRIFEPFFQISTEKKNSQGLGLGLSIVKRICDQLNAEIKIQVDNGTNFIFQFPKAPDNSYSNFVVQNLYPDLPSNTIEIKPHNPNFKTILIVEDNLSLLSILVNEFQNKYNVLYAHSGNSAIDLLNKGTFIDLIISDVMMDDGDGLEFFEHISRNKLFSFIPFIFLTAKTDLSNRLDGLSRGAVDYIAKPFVMEELNLKVESILTKLHQNAEAILLSAYSNLKRNNTIEEKNTLEKSQADLRKYNLSTREIEVLEQLVQGLTSKEIGEHLFISENTVNKHIQNIFSENKFQ